METTTFKVIGMTCQGCVNSVTRVLQSVPGVGKVASIFNLRIAVMSEVM